MDLQYLAPFFSFLILAVMTFTLVATAVLYARRNRKPAVAEVIEEAAPVRPRIDFAAAMGRRRLRFQ